MKKSIFLFFSVLTAMFVQGKNHTIVVRTDHAMPKGSTEVKVDPTGNGEVLTITPADDVTTITVTVKDMFGEVIAEGDVPATMEGVYEVTTPETTEGNVIEVSDDNGVVYSEIE